MLEWTGVIQNLNDNQSLCNSLIKRKADELLKTDTLTKSNQGKIKEYKQEAEFTINSQYGMSNMSPKLPNFYDTSLTCSVCFFFSTKIPYCIPSLL